MEIPCSIKEIQKIIPVSKSNASRKILLLRDVLGKPKPKIVTVNEFREYFCV